MNLVQIKALNTPIPPGAWVTHGGLPWRLIGYKNPDTAIIHRPRDLHPQEAPAAGLQQLELPGVDFDRLRPLSSYPEAKQLVALERCAKIEQLLQSGINDESLLAAAQQLKVSRQTMIRYIYLHLLSGGRQAALVPGVFRFGVTNHTLSREVEDIIGEGIAKHYYTLERKPLQAVATFVERECERRSKRNPSLDTIRQRISECPPREAALHRYGLKKVREDFDPLYRRRPDALHPLAKIEIDHTRLNIMAVTKDGRKRRPWITIAADDYSRAILGIYLSFDPPSWLSVALCLYRVATNKEEWLRSHGLTYPWPCHGFPKLVQADSAEEFHGSNMERVSLDWNFVVQSRLLGLADFGGRIERIMGAAAYAMEFLGGKTFRSVTEKGDYDPEKFAVYTKDALERYLLIFFAGLYNNTPHRSLRRRTPLNRWLEGMKEMGDQCLIPPDPDPSFLMSLLPSIDRTIQQQKVEWESISYFDSALFPFIRTKNPETRDGKFRFHYNPHDIRFLYTRLPGTSQWIQVQGRDLGAGPKSIWERDDENLADREAAEDQAAKERARHARSAMLEQSEEQEAVSLKEHRKRRGRRPGRKDDKDETKSSGASRKDIPAELSLLPPALPAVAEEVRSEPLNWETVPRISGRYI